MEPSPTKPFLEIWYHYLVPHMNYRDISFKSTPVAFVFIMFILPFILVITFQYDIFISQNRYNQSLPSQASIWLRCIYYIHSLFQALE